MSIKLAKKSDQKFFENVKIKLKESGISLLHNEILLDKDYIEEISLILLEYIYIWFVAVNETKTLFYTSDNPFVIHGYLNNNGIKGLGVEIVFPKLALVMRDKKYFSSTLLFHNRFLHVSEEYVRYCNSLQIY